MVAHVIAALARARGASVADVIAATTANAVRVFGTRFRCAGKGN